jgi:hypothetical protein
MPVPAKVLDYDSYVQERILDGTMSIENMYYLMLDLIDELEAENESKKEYKERLEAEIKNLPMPIELIIHYVSRDKLTKTSQIYIHDSRSHSLSDLIIILGRLKHTLFSLYRKIMKDTHKKFHLYDQGNWNGGITI